MMIPTQRGNQNMHKRAGSHLTGEHVLLLLVRLFGKPPHEGVECVGVVKHGRGELDFAHLQVLVKFP